MTRPRFLADAMLGRLARWLRVLDFDTLYDVTHPDPLLVQIANAERRTLLTRDRHLLRDLHPEHALEIRSDVPLEQLAFVVRELGLTPPTELFVRCMLCNTPLSPPLPDEEAIALIPEGAQGLRGPVRRCPGCARIYWPGSHARRMRASLEAALPGWYSTPASGSVPSPR